jgi:cell division protein FtsA
VIPVGGFNISNDLAIGLKISLEKAEKLKMENCTENLSPSLMDKSEVVEEIIQPRCEELFNLIKNDAGHDPSFEKITGNIVLSGGGSKLRGIDSIAETVFGSRVHCGRLPDLVGLSELVDDESWNVSIGLLQRGGEMLVERFEEKRGTKDYFSWVVEGFKKVANTF